MCGRFAGDRTALTSTAGVVASDTMLEVMLNSEHAWRAVAFYVHVEKIAAWVTPRVPAKCSDPLERKTCGQV